MHSMHSGEEKGRVIGSADSGSTVNHRTIDSLVRQFSALRGDAKHLEDYLHIPYFQPLYR